MKVAIIPARGGSRRIPRKNIKLFCGKPMIAWAIEAAKKASMFDRIVVTTDDEEIGRVARQYGAETPFYRPDSLSDDITPTVPVIAHAVQECLNMGWPLQYVCCIYPGAPFIEKCDLARAYELIVSTEANFVYPVTEYPHPIQRAMRRLSNGQMEFLDPTGEMTRTQDFEHTFHDAGQFYWGKADAWLEHKKMHSDGVGMVIPNWRVVDIDNINDWKRAELLSTVLVRG